MAVESLYLLIPFSILLAFVIGGLFWWATRSGQFDDLEGPGHRILMDDDSDQTRQQTAAALSTVLCGLPAREFFMSSTFAFCQPAFSAVVLYPVSGRFQ